MIAEAIILAGGLGTRLRSVVADVPKCMAPVNGRPFLEYIIHYLQVQGIYRMIFSLGYKHELIEEFLQKEYSHLNYTTVIESEPLGTGGAIKLACMQAAEQDVFVVNGDTFFDIPLDKLSDFFYTNSSTCSVALKPMEKFSRYGSVKLENNNVIAAFNEKQFCESGLINGGIYALNKQTFLQQPFPEKFSFEQAFLEKSTGKQWLTGCVFNSYFIDIGIPEDFDRAQTELSGIL